MSYSLKRLASGKWQVRWRDKGREQRARNFRTRELALDFARRLERGEAGQGALTFAAWAEVWRRDYAAVTKSEQTAIGEWQTVERYLLPAFGAVNLADLRESHLVALRARLKATTVRGGKPMAAKTVNNILVTAREILKRAVGAGKLAASPWAGVSNLRVEEKDIVFWTIDERERFLSFCRVRDPELAELVLVACHTGLRRGELKALRRNQLDFAARRIKVNATFDDHLQKRLERSKNKRVGYVPMNEVVYAALVTRKLMASDGDVFRRELFADFYDRLRRRCREAGVTELGPHGLRHTFASTLVMAGVPIYTVSRYMRHSSVAMTERYAHLAPDYLGEAIEATTSKPKGFG